MPKEEMNKIGQEIKNCRRCDLWKTRNNYVIGEGSLSAKIMLIGEAPGYNEDLQGKPFVGAAGKFLDELLSVTGLIRKDIYITNILKCRPPQNREPKTEEVIACTPYLDRQIKIIKPNIICTLGNFATSYILEKFGFKPQSIGKIHGKILRVSNLLTRLKIIPLYHPATVLYKPYMKKIIMEDWLIIKREMSENENHNFV